MSPSPQRAERVQTSGTADADVEEELAYDAADKAARTPSDAPAHSALSESTPLLARNHGTKPRARRNTKSVLFAVIGACELAGRLALLVNAIKSGEGFLPLAVSVIVWVRRCVLVQVTRLTTVRPMPA